MIIKDILRNLLIFFHLDITKNLQYDRLTKIIMKKVINRTSNCIDIGCHKGEILNMMIRYAPEGKHYAFEPIPYFFAELEKRFKERASIFPYALSDRRGYSTFQFVKNAPAYSGLKRRKYDISHPEIEEITVEVKTLDEVIPMDEKIDFIKIDVEGAEFGVLKGAKKLLLQNKPTILFECGKGASDYYGTNPHEIYEFLTQEIGLKIFMLTACIKNKFPLTKDEFEDCYQTNAEYYFVAK